MADPTTVTQVLPAPILEGALTAFTKKLEPLIGQQINTAAYAPQIAAESQLQQDARTAAGGLGSLVGPQAFEQFMSPYQQEVIDTTLAEFDRQAALNRTGMRDRAIQAGAFGGGREGVMAAEFDARNQMQRAGLQAQLLQQGFQQAQAAAAADLAARQGLGTYQTQLGQAGQAQTQAGLDAAAAAAREAQFEPFTRLGLVGQQLAQIQPGAFPTQTVGYAAPAAPASPLSTALGVGTGIASIGSKLGLFG
tara:strand:+ start:885 stop:1634 length:750 start_codon:yes stop_codon:yes gene_type:complete